MPCRAISIIPPEKAAPTKMPTEAIIIIRSEHYAHQDSHDFIEVKILRLKNAVPRDIHHSAGKSGADENADGSDNHYLLEPERLGTDRRIQKIHGVVAHAYGKIKDGEAKEQKYSYKIKCYHKSPLFLQNKGNPPEALISRAL